VDTGFPRESWSECLDVITIHELGLAQSKVFVIEGSI